MVGMTTSNDIPLKFKCSDEFPAENGTLNYVYCQGAGVGREASPGRLTCKDHSWRAKVL